MSSLDLSGVQEYVEGTLMLDTDVTITRDPEGTADDTWDPETLEYTAPVGDVQDIYEGKCYISSEDSAAETVEGGQDTIQTWYFLNLPLGSPPIENYDLVTCTRNDRDPELVNATFLVQTEGKGTFKVKKRIRMRRVILTTQ